MIDKATAKAIANVIQSEIKKLRTDFDESIESLTVDLELKLQVMTDRLASVKDGTDGVAGKDGTDGINGSDGIDGRDGLPGRDGIKGDCGTDGINGTDGEKGETGDVGAQGIRGRKGIKGDLGTGIEDVIIDKDTIVVMLTDGNVKKLEIHDDD